MLKGIAVYNSTDQQKLLESGYLNNAQAYSIIRKIAKTAATIPFNVYTVKNQKAFKEYKNLQKQKDASPQHLMKLYAKKEQAFELVEDENNPIQKLLENPNPIYDKSEFREGFYTFRLTTGNAYIYQNLLEFGADKNKPSELWLLPSQYVSPLITTTFPRSITGYKLQLGELYEFGFDEVLHSRYFNPEFDSNGKELIGLSPLRAAAKTLQRSDDETNYSVSAFQNSGISGIVSNESISPDETNIEAAGQMKSAFYSEATGVKNAKKLLFTLGKINYTPIGLSPVDMNLIESGKMTFKTLCNIFGVSTVLFNDGQSSTESNVKEMVKQLYLNAALPEAYAFRDAFNNQICPKFNDGNKKYYVDCDLTEITALQEDMKAMAETFSALPIMIPNFILETMGYGKQDNPDMDKVYIKNGYTPIDELSINTGDL
jgi:HK97 family phage portal protein